LSGGAGSMAVMAQNFLTCDREQALLLPPDLRDWLPADHLAWLVLDVVDEIDLEAFLADYRVDGWGRAAFDPAMMVALTLYSYAIGERASRRIEQRCREDSGAPTHGDRRGFHNHHGRTSEANAAYCEQAGKRSGRKPPRYAAIPLVEPQVHSVYRRRIVAAIRRRPPLR